MIKRKYIKKISYESFISLICFILIGKHVQKITIKSLINLCSRVKEYYNQNNIIYNNTALLTFLNTYNDKDHNYKHIQLFRFINDEIQFLDNTEQVLKDLSSLFTNIKEDEFFNLYAHINTFINMYQLIDDIEYKN